jgi:hypothetical protein
MTESRLPQAPRRTVAAGRSRFLWTKSALDFDTLRSPLPAR